MIACRCLMKCGRAKIGCPTPGASSWQIAWHLANRQTAMKVRYYRYETPITVHVAPSTSAATPKILLIGDSLTNRQIGAFLSPKLTAIGMTPTFVGTMNGIGADGGDTTGPLGEGREGWMWGDYTYQQTRFPAVAIGGEATYLAASKATKLGQNPFIVAGTGPGSFNGYKFDFGQYLSRFSITTPDYVLIALGRNDITWVGSGAVAQITAALGAIIPSIRSAAPSAKIAITTQVRPRSVAGDADIVLLWPVLKELISMCIRLLIPMSRLSRFGFIFQRNAGGLHQRCRRTRPRRFRRTSGPIRSISMLCSGM